MLSIPAANLPLSDFSIGEKSPSLKQAVHKALELDDSNCEAHLLLGRISWQYDWDWQTAEKECPGKCASFGMAQEQQTSN
ncbi:MAG TPA: hypothetical protein VFA40_03465 [Terriglobales bacterium]|nr:hypothetical protein [Terriglobales bacterium]